MNISKIFKFLLTLLYYSVEITVESLNSLINVIDKNVRKFNVAAQQIIWKGVVECNNGCTPEMETLIPISESSLKNGRVPLREVFNCGQLV